MSDEIVELHAIIKGRVQGVGFRYVTCLIADKLKLNGTVKNMSDGTVEIYAQGNKEVLEFFLQELLGERGPGHIDTIDKNFYSPSSYYNSFDIIY